MKGKSRLVRVVVLAALVSALAVVSTGTMAQQPEGGEIESIACGDNVSCNRTGWAARISNSGGGGVFLAEQDAYSVAIKGSGRPGVFGSSGAGIGVKGTSTNGAAVWGRSTNDSGVFGRSTAGDGVYGTSEDQDGVRGLSTGGGIANYGVYGETNSTDTYDAGVKGYSTSNASGVIAISTGGWGAYLSGANEDTPDIVLGGTSAANDNGNIYSDPNYPASDILLVSNDEVHVHLDNNEDEDGHFAVYNGANAAILYADEEGDVALLNDAYVGNDGGNGTLWAVGNTGADLITRANGDIYAYLDDDNDAGVDECFYIREGDGAIAWSVCENAKGMTASGPSAVAVETGSGPRKLYAVSSTELWFEDFGRADLVEGHAIVEIDPLFAETVNMQADYHVYLTPISGELVVLVVKSKTPTSFEVQGATLDGSPASFSFDYRIVAKRIGYEEMRLETADLGLGDHPPVDDPPSINMDPDGEDQPADVPMVLEISLGEE